MSVGIDHRYYHHSRINQSLHLVSAISFLVAYGLLLIDPPMAALLAWFLVGMTTRQAGHFFFSQGLRTMQRGQRQQQDVGHLRWQWQPWDLGVVSGATPAESPPS